MRTTSLLAALIALVILASPATAGTAVRLEIAGIVEAPGKMTVTVATAGSDGRPLLGLNADNFRVSIGETPLVIKEAVPASSTGIPASILIYSDASRRMTAPVLTQTRASLHEFVNGLQPGDRAGVIAYNTATTSLIDVTPERVLVNQAINRLGGAGEADLFAAVSDAARRTGNLTPERRIVLLVSAGPPLASPEKRAASLQAARNTGVMYYAVALGEEADRDYLNELAGATGGRLLFAEDAVALRNVLSDLAGAISSQYALVMDVPVAADRTLPGRLDITVNAGGESASVQRAMQPLPGAIAPTFPMKVGGLVSGQRVTSPVNVQPAVGAEIKLAKVEYAVDNNPPLTVTEPPFALPVDPSTLNEGNHILKIVATDTSGRRAELQVPFAAALPPPPGRSLPIIPIMSLVALAGIAYLGFALYQRRRRSVPDYTRAKPWSTRPSTVPVRIAPSVEPAVAQADDAEPPDDRLHGRLLVMDERPEMRGQTGSVREYELRGSPLTLGVGSTCNVRVEDATGEIANEEARIWVQKRRMVYHKLTTLSAMATEGMVSGWLFLDDGDEMRVGTYRLVFQAARGDVDFDEEALREAARNFGSSSNLGSRPAA